MKALRISAATIVIFAALASIGYSMRALIPVPLDYITRLEMLEGWSSRGFYGLNCSGFLTNAHGENFLTEQQMYAGEGNLEIVAVLPDRYAINEAELEPGDIAAFHGEIPGYEGVHVAAFMGGKTWIDSDSRRGFVATYELKDKPASDPWFKSDVRILRWKSGVQHAATLGFFEAENAAILAEVPRGKS